MKVDMSPKAVTERLRTLNELWILSVKLMNSKKIKDVKDKAKKSKFDERREDNSQSFED
jgi:hypothetical protein